MEEPLELSIRVDSVHTNAQAAAVIVINSHNLDPREQGSGEKPFDLIEGRANRTKDR